MDDLLSLKQALRVGPQACVAFSGAGGKTTALFRLARELRAASPTVLVTTTTHFSVSQPALGDHHLRLSGPEDLPAGGLPEGVVVLTSDRTVGERIAGLEGAALQRLHALARANGAPLLIEADGSRMRPLKAPAPHEPAIPPFTETAVVVAGLSALGQPLTETWVHRPERYAALAGLEPGREIDAAAVVRVLTHPQGGLQGIPPAARRIVMLNQVETDGQRAAGGSMADALLDAYDSVVLAAVTGDPPVGLVREPVGAVVLAAGASSRMGTPKPLLDWGGKPLVVRAAETALAAGCRPVVVVTGAGGEAVQAAVAHLPVRCVHNPAWQGGQSTSVRAGLAALPEQVGAALFLLVDQPFVSAPLLRGLIDLHAETLVPIVAPLIDGQRGNPVLFDRSTFTDFDRLTGDVGARPLFSRHRAAWLPWHDPRALMDLDTLEAYQRSLPGEDQGLE